MRQHVNPLSKNFNNVESIPPLKEIFKNPKLPLHIDIGSASGDFLFDLALDNNNWNYLGIEIRKKLINNAKKKVTEELIPNLYFLFGNANNIFNDNHCKSLLNYLSSISFNFPDPWFKKRHFKRRVIQPELIKLLSNSMQDGSKIFIKTDVKELFEYMNKTLLSNKNFKKLDIEELNYSESFNPKKIRTNREKYVIINKLNIYEKIYIKI